MKRHLRLALAALFFLALSIQSDAILHRSFASAQNNRIPEPTDVLGFTPGDDRKLANWAKVVEYFQKLAASSDRVKFEEIGKSTMGAPFVYATISAPENLRRLNEFKEIQRQLADPRLLGAGSAASTLGTRTPSSTSSAKREQKTAGEGARDPSARKARDLIARGKTIVAITCGIHSTEVGSYLSSMLIAYRLASSNDPETQEILRNTIILLVPSTNPDGVDIVNNWYQKTLGTPYEGTDPPELYHKYTGHDDNRDWYAFTQVETQLVVDKILNVWHPQIVHDIHQQGAFGSRLFLPPYMQPVEPNVPKQIVEGYTELGNFLAKEMRAAGFKGITTDSTYDAWSPSRAYSHYHGGVRILQETASARLATPITIKFEQLQSREGYDPQKESANFGPVWRGGEWHIRDITNTMTTVAFFLLKHAAQNREHWLQRFYEIEKEAVRPRKDGELFGFLFDPTGLGSETLRGIFEHAGVSFSPVERGYLVRIDQPNGMFAKAVLETQRYPDLRNQKGQPIQPYDVTAHTLSLLLNLNVVPVNAPFRMKPGKWGLSGADYGPCPRTADRNGLYKSYVPSMDEGWTRWVLESQRDRRCVGYATLKDAEVRAANLRAKYDTIIIPDQPRNTILNGHRKGAMPDEYTGGLGEAGVKALREFVEQGGTLVCLNRASDFAIEQFKLPVRDVVDGLPHTDFYVPGSILQIQLDTNDPIAQEMPKESIAWVENSPVFEVMRDITFTGRPNEEERFFPPHVHVIARYPSDKDPLLSGWLLGGDRIKGKAALVEVGLGKGRIILFGFRPQYRGQSLATYPLFFNAISLK
ncbi:MAG TPA: M14 family metallopeptidase [Pyrinomonadaceae bacterium]|jgi:murein tripeptide amidase MpaA